VKIGQQENLYLDLNPGMENRKENKMGKKEEVKYKEIVQYSEEYYDGILSKDRYIFLYGGIDLDTAYMINTKLLVMEKEDFKRPICIEINSPGGSIIDGLSIIDTMQHIKPEVITIVSGMAASMGAIIAAAGDKRYSYPNAQIMFHSASGMVGDYLNHIKDRTNWLVKIENRINNLLKEKTAFTEKEYFKMTNGELWLNAREGLKLKLIDKII